MQLVMFSGNSLRNRDWIYEAKEQFAGLFDNLYVQQYRHWESGADWIDLPHELQVLREQQVNLESDYGIFAKSIGTVLAVQAIEQRIIQPKWLLFCGLPMDYIAPNYPRFATVLAESKLPVTVVHNQHDKVGDAAAVSDYLREAFAGRDNFRFIGTPGETHDYEDYELFKQQLVALQG